MPKKKTAKKRDVTQILGANRGTRRLMKQVEDSETGAQVSEAEAKRLRKSMPKKKKPAGRNPFRSK